MNGDQKQKGSHSRIANYQKILATNPRSFIFAQLAEEYIKLGDIDRAIDICRKGLEFNPDFSDGLYVLGVAFFKKGMRDNARNIFFRILKKQPDHYLASEALRRLGFSEDQIAQAVNDNNPLSAQNDDAEVLGLEEVVVDEAPPAPEPPTPSVAEASNTAGGTSARRRVPTAAGDVRSAYRAGVSGEQAPINDDSPDGLPAWLKVGAVVLVIALIAGAAAGWYFYQRHQKQLEITQLVTDTYALLAHDTLNDQRQAVEALDRAVVGYPKVLPLRAQLVEAYARLLIDFDPGNLEYQRKMETLVAQFPADNLNDAMMLRAQAFRAMSLGKLGEVGFMVETAGERRLQSAALLSLRGDIHLIDREFDKAIAVYDQALAMNQAELRAMYKKARAQMGTEDYSAAKITLDLLLEQAPEHLRGQIARWECILYGKSSVREVEPKLMAFFKAEGAKLPPIPRARLLFLTAIVHHRLDRRAEALEAVRESVRLHPQPEPLFLLARIQFDQKQFEQAKLNVQRAIEINAEARRYHALLGRIYFYEGNRTRALEEMELAIGEAGDDPLLLELAGDAARELRNWDKAADYYRRASLIKSQDANLKKKLILTFIDKQDMKDARRRIEKLLTFNADDPMTYFLQGRYLLAMDKPAQAKKEFEKGLELDPKHRELLLEMVKINVRENNVEQALRILYQLEKLYPEDVDVLDTLAGWAFAAASWEEARALYRRLMKVAPQVADYRLRMAFLDYQDGKQAEARQAVEQELARDANLGYGHILRGVFLFLEGDLKTSEAQIIKGVKLDSKNPEGHYWLGRIKLAGNDTTWAKSEFELALECQAVHPRSIYEIGVIQFRKGQKEAARKRFVDALKSFALFNDTAGYQMNIYLRLGEIAVSQNRVREALNMFTQANKLNPEAAEPYYYLAREALDKFKNVPKTIRTLKKAITLDPKFAPAYFELGLVFMARDRNREAADAFQDYLRLEPKGDYASEARRYLEQMGR